MNEFAPAEASNLLPDRAKALLQEYGHGGHYFEMYARRNYFDRPLFKLSSSSIHTSKPSVNETVSAGRESDVDLATAGMFGASKEYTSNLPYVISVYELRRVLAISRRAQEDFTIEYTRLPNSLACCKGSISAWRKFDGPKTIYSEYGAGSVSSCVISDPNRLPSKSSDGNNNTSTVSEEAMKDLECPEDTEVRLPPPPAWLQKLLLPYPIPVFPDSKQNEPYCST